MEVPTTPSTATTPASHLELLAVADVVHQATIEADLTTVHRELCRLRNALVEHLQGEEPVHGHLPLAAQGVVQRGQQGLVRLLSDLLLATTEEDEDCPCIQRVAELRRALSRQARLETRILLATER